MPKQMGVRRGLVVHTGPMASGKSEALIEMMMGQPHGLCVAFRPFRDTRGDDQPMGYGSAREPTKTFLQSRAGVKHPAIRIQKATDALALVGAAEIVCFDEAHMYPEGFDDAVQSLLAVRKWVHVAGLDMDWRGVPFEPMPVLCALADMVHKYRAHCGECLTKSVAVHTGRRYVPEGGADRIAVGDLDEYVPLCRECWTTWPYAR